MSSTCSSVKITITDTTIKNHQHIVSGRQELEKTHAICYLWHNVHFFSHLILNKYQQT